jgi:archaetidylinositol phosphate synthase
LLLDRYRQIEVVTKYSNYYLGKFYTWLSTPITERAAAWGLHPNHITLLSVLVATVGCFYVGTGTHLHVIVGAVLLYLSYVLDWCDGQLARFTGKVSPFGGWLDQISDRTKEGAYVFVLAFGYQRQTGSVMIWAWAFAALFFLFLLEYYGQMSRAIPEPERSGVELGTQEEQGHQLSAATIAPRTRRVVIDFSIDEQYFVLVLGLLLVGSAWTLEAIAILAALMALYKPIKGWRRYYLSRIAKGEN